MREAHAGALAAPRGVVGTRAALAEPAAAAARTIGLAFELRRIGRSAEFQLWGWLGARHVGGLLLSFIQCREREYMRRRQ